MRQSQTKRYRRNIWCEIEALQANKNSGGCALGQHCKLSHEKPGATDSAGTSQNKTNGLSSGSAKEAQTNGRPALRPYHSESNSGQQSGAGVSPGTGNDSQANGHMNYKSPIEGMTAAREVWKQHKDAVIGYRHEGPRSRGVQEALNFNSRDGGVSLGSSSAYDSSSQAKKVSDSHNSQYGHPIRPTPTVERIDKAVGKNHNIDSSPHGPTFSHRRDFPSQNWPSNWQKNRPPLFAQRPARDQNGMTRGSNSGPDLIPRTKPIGTGNGTVGTARLSADVRDLSNGQTRVIFHDPKFPAMTERPWEPRPFLNNIRRASVSSELPAATYHISTEAPRVHEWKGHQTQEGLSHASPLLGDPGGGNSSKQVPKYGVGNSFAHAGLTPDLPEGARSELRGGGVALNNYPRTNYIPENKNGSIPTEASNTLAKLPTRDLKVETNSSERNLVKNQDCGSLGPSTYSASKSPGTGDGGEIQSQLVIAMRKIGKMDPRATPWSPETARRGSTASSLGEGNRAGHSNLKGVTKVLLTSDTGLTNKKQIGNGFSGSRISGSLGNRPAVSQQVTRPTETPLRKPRGPGFNEMGDSEGGAKIGGIEHDEHEEGGAKLPIEQNVQLEPHHPQANVGPVKNNQPTTNDAVSPLQEILPPPGQKYQFTYTGKQNNYHPHNSGQEYHIRANSAVQFRGGHRFSTQNTVYPRPRYSHQFWPEVGGARQYQSSGHGYGVAAVPNNITPTRLQLDNRNVPLNTSFVPNSTQELFRRPQSQPEPTSLSHSRDSAHHRLDRSIRSPQALSFHPTSDLSSLYRPQSLNQQPPAMLSYESSLNSQGIQSDAEQNRRSYTPEPEELDRSALRLYYDDRRTEARASDMNRGWEGNSGIKVDGSTVVF